MASGGTPEYNSVLSNLIIITKHLKVNEEAKESLILMYKQEKWLTITAKPEDMQENKLVNLALVMIESDTKHFDIFITMLENITGMDEVVKKLKGT